jgi:hypothetical protein
MTCWLDLRRALYVTLLLDLVVRLALLFLLFPNPNID